jgi:hypothetical protein
MEKNHKGQWCGIIQRTCQEGFCSNCQAYINNKKLENKVDIQMPECSECDKMLKVAPDSQKLGYFLDWLTEQDMAVCTWDSFNEQYVNCHENIENLLARYFGIDLKKVEQEKRALLDVIRSQGSPSAKVA